MSAVTVSKSVTYQFLQSLQPHPILYSQPHAVLEPKLLPPQNFGRSCPLPQPPLTLIRHANLSLPPLWPQRKHHFHGGFSLTSLMRSSFPSQAPTEPHSKQHFPDVVLFCNWGAMWLAGTSHEIKTRSDSALHSVLSTYRSPMHMIYSVTICWLTE